MTYEEITKGLLSGWNSVDGMGMVNGEVASRQHYFNIVKAKRLIDKSRTYLYCYDNLFRNDIGYEVSADNEILDKNGTKIYLYRIEEV